MPDIRPALAVTETPRALVWRIVWTGALGALPATLCCLVPAVVTAAGLGALSGLVSLSLLQPYSLALGLALVGLLSWRAIHRSCCAGRQRMVLYLSPVFTLAVLGAVYGGVAYLVVPLFSGPMADMPTP